MQPPHHHSRINLAELKAQLVKKLGGEGSKQYFYYLHRFLSLKLSKVEFNKLCLRIIGRENIPLHNHFIRSILRNACSAKAPPPAHHKHDVLRQNGSHASVAQASGSPGLSNGGGDVLLPLSPRKVRTGVRRRSALGPNGKASFAVLENGDSNSNASDMGRPLQQLGNQNEILVVSAPCGKDQNEILVVRDDAKEASARSPLRAPLGVPLCPVSIGGACRAPPLSSSGRCIGSCSNGALLDSLTLRERMEQIALIQGLEGVSVDSANVLNHGLDAYMKGLIRSCIELVGSRSGHDSTKNKLHPGYMKVINGVKPGHQLHSGKATDVQEQTSRCPISLHDFRVAMELNPRRLGQDWPLLLEKICTHAFEE